MAPSVAPETARLAATEKTRFYERAHHFIAVSHSVRRHLIEQGICGSRIAVLYNGIDLDHNRAPLSKAEAKARLGLPAHARTVGVAASFNRAQRAPFSAARVGAAPGLIRPDSPVLGGRRRSGIPDQKACLPESVFARKRVCQRSKITCATSP